MTDARRGGRLSRDERGQTLQDYVVGISIFAVVVIVALGFFPGLLEGFQTGSLGDHEAQADRVGREIVSETSVSGGANELDVTKLETLSNLDEDELRERYGIRDTVNLNITVETLNSRDYVTYNDDPLVGQPEYYGAPAGSTARIVTLSGEDIKNCTPACRLVVRAW